MKTTRTIIALIGTMLLTAFSSSAQTENQSNQTLAILGVDANGIIQEASTVRYMVQLELDKLEKFTVMDKYDINDIVSKSDLDPSACFGRSCLVEAGKLLKVDKMLAASVERFGEKIVITLRLIDVASGKVEKTHAMEFLNLQPELQKMVEISVKGLLDVENDPNLVNLLVDYDAPVTSPKTTLRLSGPRMGASYLFGPSAQRLQDSKENGGYEMFPVMSQFGYQYETQYLSAGNFQALIEFVGLIGGLESGKFIPSLAFLNGFRGNQSGWEFAFGPSFKFAKYAQGYYDEAGNWSLQSDWVADQSNYDIHGNLIDHGFAVQELPDNRGDIKLNTNLVIAVGKTFRSGYLNIPVNAYIIPNKKGTIVGASFGFNINKKPKYE